MSNFFKDKKHVIWAYITITFGLAIYTFAWSAFLLPSKIISGGVTGLSSIIYFLTASEDAAGVMHGGIPVGVTSFVINLIFLALGFKFLGRKFAVNTIYGIVMSSVFFIMWQQGLNCGTWFNVEHIGPFMCTVLGGALCGIGIGIAFNNGGNSGGTDIIALILSKYYNITPGRVILLIDVVIIGCGFFVTYNVTNVLLGYCVMFAMTYVLDMVIDGNKQSYQIMVFSAKNDEIGDAVTNEVGRGATLLDAQGCYTKSDQKVLLMLIHRTDKAIVLRIIHRIDKNAFVSISKAEGVYGKNFENLKLK